MRKWASTSAKSVLLTAGFVALGSGVAFADSDAATSGNGSVLGGNQAVVNADVPVNVSGNAIGAVLGVAGADSTGNGAAVIERDRHGADVATSGNGSLLGGNQLVVDAEIPVNVAGNAISAVGGVAGAAASDTGAVVHESHEHIATSGNGSAVGGNQLVVDGDVPVNVAGNAIAAVASVAGAGVSDTGAVVEHQSATEHQASALDAVPIVSELPEIPVSQTLPVHYEVSETTAQAVEQHAPQYADQLPQSSMPGLIDPVGQVLGAVGVGL